MTARSASGTTTPLKEALRRVTDGGMLGDVRGRRPTMELTMPLETLRREPGARQAELTWTRQAATSLALALSCDAKVSGTVTGHAQPRQRLVTLTRTMLNQLAGLPTGDRVRPGLHSPADNAATAGLPTFDWQAVSDEQLTEIIDHMLTWATEALSGPDGLAACLRSTLRDTLTNGSNRLDDEQADEDPPAELAGALLAAGRGIALPLDTGEATETVPLRIRQLVEQRDQQCRWPGCDVPAHRSHVHHLRHRGHGGQHQLTNLVVLCTRHHERFVHGLGWTIRLNGDGTVTATSPDGETSTDDRPPTARSP